MCSCELISATGSTVLRKKMWMDEKWCQYCVDVLIATLRKDTEPLMPESLSAAPPFPAFVTWKKNGELRGCMGSLREIEPHKLRDYALQSSLRDARFSPIELHELPSLTCTVTVLYDMEESTLFDWEIGVHGIIIQFICPFTRTRLSSTFLPDVAKDHNFTKKETIQQLIYKAGSPCHINDINQSNIILYRYKGKSITIQCTK